MVSKVCYQRNMGSLYIEYNRSHENKVRRLRLSGSLELMNNSLMMVETPHSCEAQMSPLGVGGLRRTFGGSTP